MDDVDELKAAISRDTRDGRDGQDEQLEEQVRGAVLKVARQRGATLNQVENHQHWTVDLGLRSLDLAQVVALLERQTGIDPFAELVPITSIRTVGDLCQAYRRCLTGERPAAAEREAGRARAARRLAARSGHGGQRPEGESDG
jgi:acyl carrier protein